MDLGVVLLDLKIEGGVAAHLRQIPLTFNRPASPPYSPRGTEVAFYLSYNVLPLSL
jgi:hypothetical protein